MNGSGGSDRTDEPLEAWTVSRRWAPRLGRETVWRRFRRRFSRTASKMDADVLFDGFAEGLLAGIALIVAILVLMFVVIPFVVALVDLLVLVLLALAGLAGRVLFRRPWCVEAVSDRGRTCRWSVVGWRRSGESVAEARQLLAAGIMPPQAVPVDPGP